MITIGTTKNASQTMCALENNCTISPFHICLSAVKIFKHICYQHHQQIRRRNYQRYYRAVAMKPTGRGTSRNQQKFIVNQNVFCRKYFKLKMKKNGLLLFLVTTFLRYGCCILPILFKIYIADGQRKEKDQMNVSHTEVSV